MGIFQRQLWKQKPQAWGPFSAVQSALFRNAERMGIDPESIALAMPMWNPGDQRDYSKNTLIGTNSGASFKNSGLDFYAAQSDIITVDGNIITSWPITFISKFITGGSGTSRPLNCGDTTQTSHYFGLDANVGVDFSYWARGGTDANIVYTTETPDANTGYLMVGRAAAANDHTLFIDGDKKGTKATTQVGMTWSNFGVGIGGLYRSSPIYSDCLVESSLIFSAALSDSIIYELSDNPYDLWQPVAQKTIFLPSGSIPSGAPDYAITANETITVTVPASALTDTTVATEASSTFTITADSASGFKPFWIANTATRIAI